MSERRVVLGVAYGSGANPMLCLEAEESGSVQLEKTRGGLL